MFMPGITNRQNDHDEVLVPPRRPRSRTAAPRRDVAKLLRCAGRVEVSDDIKSGKWMKLVVNAAELIPSALLDLPLRRRPLAGFP